MIVLAVRDAEAAQRLAILNLLGAWRARRGERAFRYHGPQGVTSPATGSQLPSPNRNTRFATPCVLVNRW